jgi:hypothetical protein
MDAHSSIRDLLNMGELVGLAYIGDLSDAELMQRPHPKCNHINWQVGHLIASEHSLMSQIGKMPELPAGFAEQYSKETGTSDDASRFRTKDELLAIYRTQRAGTVEILSALNAEALDEPTGINYAPTKGALISLHGSHWLMHCGQWVIVRRENDKPVVI